MRKVYALLAVLALSGCERTATGTQERQAGGRHDLVPFDPPITLTQPVPTISVRKVVTGLYAVRATLPSGSVGLAVRVTTGSGFPLLSSGSEIIHTDGSDGLVETQIQTTAGSRYLVLASAGESDLMDLSRATYAEFSP
jgi:hypothetical protein